MASLCKKCKCGRAGWDACDHVWLIRWREQGKEVYRAVGSNRVIAERALADHDRGPRETVSDALDAWYDFKRRDPKARVGSLMTYPGRIAHVRTVMGHIAVRDVRPEHLIGFADVMMAAERDGKRYSPATVKNAYAVLTATLKHAMRRGVIRSLPLPVDGPGIPTPRAREYDLTLAQVERVIADMPGVWGRVAEFVLLTGLRWGEVVAIRESDIDGAYLRVRRTRNRADGENDPKSEQGKRVVPLSRRARTILKRLELPVGGDYRDAHDALVAALGDLHEEGMGWHVIRNAHATLLDAAGVSLRDSAARMGHGTNYAQNLAYGLKTQAGDASALDRVRGQYSPSRSGPGKGAGAGRRSGKRKPRPGPPAA